MRNIKRVIDFWFYDDLYYVYPKEEVSPGRLMGKKYYQWNKKKVKEEAAAREERNKKLMRFLELSLKDDDNDDFNLN